MLYDLEKGSAFVPALWTLEVGNILIGAERRKRITFADVKRFLSLLAQLNINIDQETAERGCHEIIAYAYTQKLTIYDAAYLELAMRLGLPLATKDNQLREAATRLGTELLPVS